MKFFALVAITAAVRINRDPLLTYSETEPATHPINYPVPNFGVDHDIKTSLKNSEAWTPVKDDDGKWEVPANDVEFKMLQMRSNMRLAREPLLSAGASELLVHQKPVYADHPVDYKVPDFGKDQDIVSSLSNTKNEETRLKHKINFMNEPLSKDIDHPMNYKVPDFGVDEEIKYTQKNISGAEDSLNKDWKMPKDGYTVGWALDNRDNSYLQTERDPLLTWEPTAPATHPINYFVPNFGQAHEIAYTLNNIKAAEKELNHKMTADFSNTKAPVNPRDYFVPDFGQDKDITASLTNLENQEAIHGDWVLPVKAPAVYTHPTGQYISTAGPPKAPMVAGTDPITKGDPFNKENGY